MATYSFHRLLIRKVKMDNFSCLYGDIWNLFLQKCSLSSPLLSYVQIIKSIRLPGQQKGYILETMLKHLFSETIRWIKVVLFMHVYDIFRYINCVFVQKRTGCCGNFFLFFLFTPDQYSGERL